ncbi:histone H4-K20 monomethylation [Sparganum proliferum]
MALPRTRGLISEAQYGTFVHIEGHQPSAGPLVQSTKIFLEVGLIGSILDDFPDLYVIRKHGTITVQPIYTIIDEREEEIRSEYRALWNSTLYEYGLDCDSAMFADDIQIWKVIQDAADETNFQENLCRLDEWTRRWLMSFNVNKGRFREPLGSIMGRRAVVRRSVSTTDLSSKATTDVAARPSRQVAASVSPKKQLRPDLPTERPHNAGNVKHRRAAVRRSVSTSDLPSEAAADAAARPSRQMAASVSPKKQLRADQPASKPHNTGAVKYLQTQLTGFTVHRTARQVAKDLQKQREADVVLSILNSEESGMKVIFTDVKGRGVISTRTFFAGEFIVEYAGELISDSEARLREAEYKKNPNLGSFMFYFTHAGRSNLA